MSKQSSGLGTRADAIWQLLRAAEQVRNARAMTDEITPRPVHIQTELNALATLLECCADRLAVK